MAVNVEPWAHMTPEQLRAAYPGVLTAFEFVLPSYNWMIARFDAAENRLQAVQVFAVTLTFAFPGAARAINPQISFHDWRFSVSAVLFVVLTAVGLYARV